ncbi:MAG: 50S ribosomal protein L20 [Geminicoccus sp.]|jgi:large subunit ribosomal protein L20|nr:50S ribosomal protein L20 [Geminicoccus sp.]MDB2403470.1 50S ribosomal protein L20 [bacterium]
MARVKRGVTSHARHKKVLKLAKGSRGASSRLIKTAKQRVDKDLQYAYRDRRTRKRQMRGLWIQRINAGARENGLTYSQLMNGLNKAGVEVDRKVLSDIAAREPESFAAIVATAKGALDKAAA